MQSRTIETDVDTFLVALADRLRVGAAALRGLAADARDGDTAAGRVKAGLATDLDEVAATLDLLRASLCEHCAVLEVARRLSVAGKR